MVLWWFIMSDTINSIKIYQSKNQSRNILLARRFRPNPIPILDQPKKGKNISITKSLKYFYQIGANCPFSNFLIILLPSHCITSLWKNAFDFETIFKIIIFPIYLFDRTNQIFGWMTFFFKSKNFINISRRPIVKDYN